MIEELYGILVPVCGFVKSDGRECQNQIKNVGERCWRHRNAQPELGKAAPKTKASKAKAAPKTKASKAKAAPKTKAAPKAKASKTKAASKAKPSKTKAAKVPKAKAFKPDPSQPFVQKDSKSVVWTPSTESIVLKARNTKKFALRKIKNSGSYTVQTKGIGGIHQGSGDITVREVEEWIKSLDRIQTGPSKPVTSGKPKPAASRSKSTTPKSKKVGSPTEGLLLCHGKVHPIPKKFKKLADKWTCVDNDPDADPDIVADAFSKEDQDSIRRLSRDGFDVVVSMHCPMPTSFTILATFIGFSRALLKKGGRLIMPNINSHLIAKIARDMGVYPNEITAKYDKKDKEIVEYMDIMYSQLKNKIHYSDFYLDENGDGIFVN